MGRMQRAHAPAAAPQLGVNSHFSSRQLTLDDEDADMLFSFQRQGSGISADGVRRTKSCERRAGTLEAGAGGFVRQTEGPRSGAEAPSHRHREHHHSHSTCNRIHRHAEEQHRARAAHRHSRAVVSAAHTSVLPRQASIEPGEERPPSPAGNFELGEIVSDDEAEFDDPMMLRGSSHGGAADEPGDVGFVFAHGSAGEGCDFDTSPYVPVADGREQHFHRQAWYNSEQAAEESEHMKVLEGRRGAEQHVPSHASPVARNHVNVAGAARAQMSALLHTHAPDAGHVRSRAVAGGAAAHVERQEPALAELPELPADLSLAAIERSLEAQHAAEAPQPPDLMPMSLEAIEAQQAAEAAAAAQCAQAAAAAQTAPSQGYAVPVPETVHAAATPAAAPLAAEPAGESGVNLAGWPGAAPRAACICGAGPRGD